MVHKLRFGVTTIQNVSWSELIKRWRFIEKAGFDSIWVADHFAPQGLPFFEAWTTLSGIASQTSKVRFGTLVTAMPWRHPAWLARQALTLDHLSNGRLEIGLGAGVPGANEHAMVGIEDWSLRERIARFGEYVEIVDRLLRNPVTTYHGKYYQLEEASMLPNPIQKPRPPILIGARGKNMLRHVAEYADTWNTLGGFGSYDERFDAIKQQCELLDNYCKEIGRNPESIRRSYLIYEPKAISSMGKMDVYEDTEMLTDVVRRCNTLGISEIIMGYPLIDEQIPAFERMAQEVVPELRERYS